MSAVLTQQSLATRATFLVAGVLMSAWAPLVPLAKARLSLSEDQLGLLLLCLGLGSIIAMPFSGGWAARYGCRTVILIAASTAAAMLPLMATLSDALALGISLLVFGAGAGSMDVVMNIHAVAVEKDAGRPVMSGFHGMFSVGGIVGAGGLTALMALCLSPVAGCGVLMFASALLLATTARWLRTERVPKEEGGAIFAWPRGKVVLLGALCFVLFLAEGAVLDWSGVLLADAHKIAGDRAGLGYVAFATTMTIGRLTGDRIVQRLGGRAILVVGGLLSASGFLLAAWAPDWRLALAGFALVGAGASNVVPVLFTATGAQRSMPSHLALAAATTMGYAGILAGPAAIGFLARATSLPISLAVVAGLLALVAVVAKAATERPATENPS